MKLTELPPLPSYDNGRIAIFSSSYKGDALTLDAAKEYATKGIKLNVYELVNSLVRGAIDEITEEVREKPVDQKEYVKLGVHTLAKAILEQAERAANDEYCKPWATQSQEQTVGNKQIGWVVVRRAPNPGAELEYSKIIDCYSKVLSVISDWKKHVKYMDYEVYPQAVFASNTFAPVLVTPSEEYLEAVKKADLAAQWLDSYSRSCLRPDVVDRLVGAIRSLLNVQVGKVHAYIDVTDAGPRPRCVSNLSYVSVADLESGKITDYTPVFSIHQASAI